VVNQFAVNDFKDIFFLEVEVVSVLLLQQVIFFGVSNSESVDRFFVVSISTGDLFNSKTSISGFKEPLYIAFISEDILVIGVSKETLLFERVLLLAGGLVFAYIMVHIDLTHSLLYYYS